MRLLRLSPLTNVAHMVALGGAHARASCVVVAAVACLHCAPAAEQAGGAPAPREHAILGGTPVNADAWANIALLDVGCTGVLVHEQVVLYAGHCGTNIRGAWLGDEVTIDVDEVNETVTFFPTQDNPWLPFKRCKAHPAAGIGTGADLAFCELETPVKMPLVYPALGCERDEVVVGMATTLVGFGFDAIRGGSAGTKRVVETPVGAIEREVEIGTREAGTCRGDSGGPAFVRVGAEREWRLFAILSSGFTGDCGLGFYTDLAPFVSWVESETQRDITPCHDADGTWRPTVDCLRPDLDGSGAETGESKPSSTCGPASTRASDEAPPTIHAALSVWSAKDRVTVDVSASDSGSGLRLVRAELVAADRALATQEDEIEPFEFVFDGVAAGSEPFEVRVTAVDRFGNTVFERQPVMSGALVGSGGCTWAGRVAPGDTAIFAAAALLCGVLRRGRQLRTPRNCLRTACS